MNELETPAWIEALSFENLGAPDFYTSRSEIDELAPLQHAHFMRQAWDQLELSGILCIDKKPVVYVRELSEESEETVRALHLKAWSQGIAVFLVIVTQMTVRVFSCFALPTRDATRIDGDGRLISALNLVTQASEVRQLGRAIKLGTYFGQVAHHTMHKRSFDSNLRVDRYLLSNLNAARLALEAVSTLLGRRAVLRLLGRIIFTCYLVDRRVLTEEDFSAANAPGCSNLQEVFELKNSAEVLFTLFENLRNAFNGDMFAGDLQSEASAIKGSHIDILRKFLRGDDLVSEQPSLGFWAYDFSIIPIETISAIYESFLESDDPVAKKKTGVYYTPRFLSEIVLDQALYGIDNLSGLRFLDPACGSGIFLVGLFNRLAEEWRRSHPEATNDERFHALTAIVEQNLFGIDLSETACRIAALSLYLAILDQLQPREIKALPEKSLPRLVRFRSDEESTSPKNILEGDFASIPSSHGDFDVIVGNPPWARNPGSSLDKWSANHGHATAQGQIAHGFIWKSLSHVSKTGRICFLLPATVLFNHDEKAIRFQAEWLAKTRIESILNLTDLRKIIFLKAKWPTVAVRFTPVKEESDDSTFEYLVPKTDPEALRAELLILTHADRCVLRPRDLLASLRLGQLPLAWKRKMWATPRDEELLQRLDDLPKLEALYKPVEENGLGWIAGSGFQPMKSHDRPTKSQSRDVERTDLFLQGRHKARLLLTRHDCDPLGDRAESLTRRAGTPEVFEPPHVLVTKNLRTVYADFKVRFQDGVRGIRGAETDRSLLLLLTAVLDSDLARFYFFHTSSNWGVQRDIVHLNELGKLPFFLPEAANQTVANEIAVLMDEALKTIDKDQFGSDQVREDLRGRLQPLIWRYYEIDEFDQSLISDTARVLIKSATPEKGSNIITLAFPPAAARLNFVRHICASLNGWASEDGSEFRIQGQVIVAQRLDLAVVQLSIVSNDSLQEPTERESSKDLEEALRSSYAIREERGEVVRRISDLKMFIGADIFLFKPLQLRFWTQTVAVNEADEIFGHIAFEEVARA